ncbi:phosphogluconate dehydrogenase (NAD(+)-dependent, decarboxylating) [Cryobacterium sp. M15]|uniref:phosphogluconate dehydrogenase (NAD(+)-dependent, decarboxylating) n=1 Tax=Cryobacterium sp. M15 TaxID=2048291 RepID=UPI002101CAE5|nr:decarboxylating 6-phosphogluconate dehydrogenase [Cryobacterium sp. M15]
MSTPQTTSARQVTIEMSTMNMHIGLIGLGKMGASMRTRLRENGVTVTGYDRNPDVTDVATLQDLVDALPSPKTVWVMVPSGAITKTVITEVGVLLTTGDLVIDGGNSRFSDDFVHAALLAEKGIDYIDAGVSGGVWGQENGFALMVGGSAASVDRLMPVFDALRPTGPREESFVHAGEVGAGHYAKMVHNGIEYALMQAYAEGYELLAKRDDIIKDVPGTFKAWQRGTVVRSWLLELLVQALEEDPALAGIEGYVDDSGEGRWTIEEALANAVPVPAISASIFARFESRQQDSPAMKAVAALRNQFGGHAVKSAE